MEAELQKIVRVYLKSSKGKEYLGKKDFQNLVSSQLSNILTVRNNFIEPLFVANILLHNCLPEKHTVTSDLL